MVASANWNYPTAIRFGTGRIAELGLAAQAAGIERPLFVTDPGVVPLPIAQRAVHALRDAGRRVLRVHLANQTDGLAKLVSLLR